MIYLEAKSRSDRIELGETEILEAWKCIDTRQSFSQRADSRSA